MKALLACLMLLGIARAEIFHVNFFDIVVYGSNVESAIVLDLDLGAGSEVIGMGYATQAHKTASGTDVFKPVVRAENTLQQGSVSFSLYENPSRHPLPSSQPPGPFSQLFEVTPSPPPAVIALPDGILRLVVKDAVNQSMSGEIGTIEGEIAIVYRKAPRVTQFTLSGGVFTLAWTSEPDTSYWVQVSPDLQNWTTMMQVNATSSTSSVSAPAAFFSGDRNFVRVNTQGP